MSGHSLLAVRVERSARVGVRIYDDAEAGALLRRRLGRCPKCRVLTVADRTHVCDPAVIEQLERDRSQLAAFTVDDLLTEVSSPTFSEATP